MNEDQFYEFAADQYQAELSVPDRIFGRLPFVVSGIVIAAGAVTYLTSSKHVKGSAV